MALLTPEQRALGRQNANTALGVTRRDFLKAAAVAPALGAFYFCYTGIDKPVKAASIGTVIEVRRVVVRTGLTPSIWTIIGDTPAWPTIVPPTK